MRWDLQIKWFKYERLDINYKLSTYDSRCPHLATHKQWWTLLNYIIRFTWPMMLEHASSNSRARGYVEGLVLGETQSMNRNNTICSLYWQLKRVFLKTEDFCANSKSLQAKIVTRGPNVVNIERSSSTSTWIVSSRNAVLAWHDHLAQVTQMTREGVHVSNEVEARTHF